MVIRWVRRDKVDNKAIVYYTNLNLFLVFLACVRVAGDMCDRDLFGVLQTSPQMLLH